MARPANAKAIRADMRSAKAWRARATIASLSSGSGPPPVGTVDQVTAEGRPFEESVACFGHAAPPKARKRNLGAERPSLLIGQQNGLSPTPPPLSGRGAPVLERSRATGRPRIANPVAQIPIATGGSSR
jgi:hypothetical protein